MAKLNVREWPTQLLPRLGRRQTGAHGAHPTSLYYHYVNLNCGADDRRAVQIHMCLVLANRLDLLVVWDNPLQ